MGRGIRVLLSSPSLNDGIEVQTGYRIRVGRADRSDYALAQDGDLSEQHFVLECYASECRIVDCSRDGTFVNGIKVASSALQDGDHIRAGQTTFVVRSLPLPGTDPKTNLLQVLTSSATPLLAILDAARDARILPVLRHYNEQCQSLYELQSAQALAAVAPYLVSLPPQSPLLHFLTQQTWGLAWGVYLNSTLPFEEVRKHLRRFLVVRTEQGEELLFRFYDPRVLRVYLPTCSAQEAGEFLGALKCYMVEGEVPETLLRLSCTTIGSLKEKISLIPMANPRGERLTGTREDAHHTTTTG